MKAIIVGAGVGGLTTALLLNKAGIAVEVYEAVAGLRELGVGINLQPRAVKVLAELGLFQALKSVSAIPETLAYYSEDGRHIYSEPRGYTGGYDYPQLSIHRGKLQKILLAAFDEAVGREHLHLNAKLTEITESETQVEAHFVATKGKEATSVDMADVLIGADGIRSVTRQYLHPHEGPMQFEGIRMWRGTTYMTPPLDGKHLLVCGNHDVQLIMYPISKPDSDGKVELNWVAEVLDPSATSLHEDLWSHHGSLAQVLAYYADWSLDFIDIHAMFSNTQGAILEYPMVDRDPLPFWSSKRVTLLGDAAHPMYPRGSNGASQAMLDAQTLSQCLSAESISSALKNYESERLPVTAQIVQSNRSDNQVKTFDLIREHCKDKCGEQHTCVPQGAFQEIAERYRNKGKFSVSDTNS